MSIGAAAPPDDTRALRATSGSTLPPEHPGLATTYSLAPPATGSRFGGAGAAQPAQSNRVANYELGPQIGAGGMGTVFQARHLWLGRTVAIKFIAGHVLNHPEAQSRFLHECLAIGALDHPNIVRANDAGQADGSLYLVTEFVEGADLATLVARRGLLPIADACEAVRQAALGLAHAHARGLVHRDVKPSNLLLDHSGTVKVLDFGLARMAAGQTTLTVTGQVIGTLDFLAPEQATDARNVNPAGDQYSLGCTLYFLLTGNPPFAGPAYESPASKLKGHLTDRPAPVTDIRRKTPLALVACLERMMAKSPADRYDSILEVAEALAPFCADADLPALLNPDPARRRVRKTESRGMLAGVGDLAERLVAVFGWALRGRYSSQSAMASAPARTSYISLGGLAMFAVLGFVLSQFSCVPMGMDGVPFSETDVQVFQFGFGPEPPRPTPSPSQPLIVTQAIPAEQPKADPPKPKPTETKPVSTTRSVKTTSTPAKSTTRQTAKTTQQQPTSTRKTTNSQVSSPPPDRPPPPYPPPPPPPFGRPGGPGPGGPPPPPPGGPGFGGR